MTMLADAIERLRARPYVRFGVLATVDAVLWVVAILLATLARLGFQTGGISAEGFILTAAVAVATSLAIGILAGLYTGRHRLASFEEAGWLLLTTTSTTAIVFGLAQTDQGSNLVPLSAVLAAGAYQLLGAFGIRYILRSVLERSHLRPTGEERLLVYGAGDAGYEAARALLRDPTSSANPVGFLDDDRSKRSLRMLGLRVHGGREHIADVAKKLDAGTLLIAIPTAGHSTIVEIADLAIAAGLGIKILPSLSEIAVTGVQVKDIRDIELADFLEREENHLDLEGISAYISDKTVLVTGAGGSIGSELCRTLLRFAPASIVALDHAENSLHRLHLSIDDEEDAKKLQLTLADIRDVARMHEVFAAHRPHVVFHAAAHKHVPFLEDHPQEAHKTNVLGTLRVLEAAAAHDVEVFVNISTDKAAEPVNQLGATKRTAELLTSWFSTTAAGEYLSVRFGNVLGSDGSVVPTFREQLRLGRPLTITHRDTTRYFMTIPEAAELVIQAGSMGGPNDLFILDMGEPVRILDMAKRLSAVLRPGVPFRFTETGLRPGEKLHEVLFDPSDESIDKPHERIWRCRIGMIAPADLDGHTTAHPTGGFLDVRAVADLPPS